MNTASGITMVYDVLKAGTNDATKLSIIKDFDYVLSLNLADGEMANEQQTSVDSEMEAYIMEMIEKRTQAKKDRDFATADSIRDELAAKGIILKDTREGTTYEIQ